MEPWNRTWALLTSAATVARRTGAASLQHVCEDSWGFGASCEEVYFRFLAR